MMRLSLLGVVFGTAAAFQTPFSSMTTSTTTTTTSTQLNNLMRPMLDVDLPTVQAPGEELVRIWGEPDNAPVRIEGNSLRTWNVDAPCYHMQVSLQSEGRPIHANLELWNGPDYTPSKLGIYTEDGAVRPFNAVIATPLPNNRVAVYNTAEQEFPFFAVARPANGYLKAAPKILYEDSPRKKLVQGAGMVVSYPLAPEVERVQVLLQSDGRHISARIELLQGPNNIKQILDFYTSDGKKRPFYAIMETPGSANVIRLINKYQVEYPFYAVVEPYVEGPP